VWSRCKSSNHHHQLPAVSFKPCIRRYTMSAWRTVLHLLCWIAAYGCCTSLFAQQITDFGLYDQNGRFHQLSRIDSDLVILVVQLPGDSTSRQVSIDAASLQQRFKKEDVFVAALNPDVNVSQESVRSEMADLGISLPVLLDPSQVVSSSLQVDRSGEAFLINPKRLSLLYRGPLEAVVASPLADNPNIESTAYTA